VTVPAANGQPPRQIDPSGVALATLMAEHTPLLASILAELRGETLEVGVSDAYGRELTLDQFPVVGRKRILAYRTGNGFSALAVPTTGVLALTANEARLGMQLINAGANPILLYLADQPRGGVPAIWLAAGGGAWDGRLGNVGWAGNVFAVAQTAASTLAGGEV
jgi:hypothetical protein